MEGFDNYDIGGLITMKFSKRISYEFISLRIERSLLMIQVKKKKKNFFFEKSPSFRKKLFLQQRRVLHTFLIMSYKY